MVQQAQSAGVRMQELPEDLRTVSNPIVHDERRRAQWVAVGSGPAFDRQVRYGDGAVVEQGQAPITGMDTQASENFLVDRSDDLPEVQAARVDMAAYAQWLRAHYGIEVRH